MIFSEEEQRVVAAAIALAQDSGYDPDRYEITTEAVDDGWNVYFRPRRRGTKPALGDFFTVIERGGDLRLVPGK